MYLLSLRPAWSQNKLSYYDCMLPYGWERCNLSLLPRSVEIPLEPCREASCSAWPLIMWQAARTISGSTGVWALRTLVLSLFFPVLIETPLAFKLTYFSFHQEVLCGSIYCNPKWWGCYKVRVKGCPCYIYHPGLGSLIELGHRAWNISILKCLLEGGGPVGSSPFRSLDPLTVEKKTS